MAASSVPCTFGGLKQSLRENLAPAGATTRTVALTFDDGPSTYTDDVLAILREQKVRATFFVIGKQVKAMPDVLASVAAAGHVVGNHTWSHRTPASSTGWARSAAVSEIDTTNALVQQVTGKEPCLFRPPGGVVKGIDTVARSRSMAVTLWSVDTKDWLVEKRDPTAKAVTEIVAAARAGLEQADPIVLMHDGGGDRAATVAALPKIIAMYRAAGYSFVTVAST